MPARTAEPTLSHEASVDERPGSCDGTSRAFRGTSSLVGWRTLGSDNCNRRSQKELLSSTTCAEMVSTTSLAIASASRGRSHGGDDGRLIVGKRRTGISARMGSRFEVVKPERLGFVELLGMLP